MIAAIAGDLGHEEIEQIIRAAEPGGAVRVERRLYYPYYWIQLRHVANIGLGPSAVRVSCLVDARIRLGATADPFELEHVEPNERDVVAPAVDAPEARRIAERYSRYVLRNRRRAFVAPSVEVLSCDLVYKPFWIVRRIGAREAHWRLLVDGVTGGFYPLRVVS